MVWLIANWRLIAFASLVATLGGYSMTMRLERDNARSEYAEFKAQAAKAAWQAAEKALQETIIDQKRKEAADAENAAALATLADTIGKLRARSSGNRMPALTACSANPSGADRERAVFISAYRDLLSEVRAEADRCSERTVKLNSAKGWARASSP